MNIPTKVLLSIKKCSAFNEKMITSRSAKNKGLEMIERGTARTSI